MLIMQYAYHAGRANKLNYEMPVAMLVKSKNELPSLWCMYLPVRPRVKSSLL